jgi:putative endopeptidase
VRGVKTEPPRIERLILELAGPSGSAPLGQAVGELYVAKAFSPRAQQRATAMVEDIRSAMRERIRALGWMGEAGKQRALAKLDAMAVQVGGPPKPRDYGALALKDDDYAGNMLRVAAWEAAERGAELDTPVDRQRWNTSPHVVNAFAGALNRIVFPAGILQPPFFDENADDAVNFGGIGAVIGHEITHHFDDRGRQFDEVGNLADWWTAEDAAAYKARADRVAALYGRYEALPGVFVNGRQTLGENISDLGGLQIAYDALQIALARPDAKRERIDRLTPEQRFFTANAVVWRIKQRDEALQNQVRTGAHSPGAFRVRGPMANMPAFAQAFGCKTGDAMSAAEPVAVW